MDGSWQIKCASSTWSSPPSLAPLGPGNQMDMNLGHYFHPYVAQEANKAERAIIQESMVFSTLNLGSGKSGKPEQGNSFLALLSGPSQQLQCEFQQLSDSRSSVAANKIPIEDSGVVVNGSGSGFPVNHISSFSQPYGKVGMGNVSELRPASLHHGGPDLAKSVLHHGVDRNETRMEASSQRLGWLAGTSLPNASHHHATNTLVSRKVLSIDKSVMSGYSSSFAKGQPRVFCLRNSGELFLSDTGLLGVVCLCHDMLMSVAKFCEHSGSCDVNPGNAVRIEGGETVAQWRKLNFLKLGIRVPDENRGWDWPDGISVPGSLVKSVTTAAPDISKNPEILRPVDLFGGLARPGLPCSDFVSPNNPCTGQAFEKSVNKNMHNPSQMNSPGGHNVLLKSFAGTSNSILPALADNQTLQAVKESHMPRGLAISKSALNKGRQDNGYQSVVDYIDLISKGGNPLVSNPSLGNLKSFAKDSDTRSCYNSREACIMDRDAVSSSIELRLGQPSQQIHTLGAPIPPAMQPQPFDMLFNSQKSQFNEALINRVVTPRVMEESRQNLWCASVDASNSNIKEKENHLNLMSHALRSVNAMDPVKVGQFKVDPAKNSQISMFLSNFSNPFEGGIQFQATDNLVNNSAHFIPRALDGEQDSHFVKSRPVDFPRNRTDGREWKFNIDESGLSSHVDKGKGSRPVTDNYSHIAAIPNSLVHNRRLANSSPSTGIIGGPCLHSSSSVHDRQFSPYLHQSSAMLPYASDPVNQFGKSCLGSNDHPDHILLGSINSAPVTAGPSLPSSVAPMGVSSTNPIYLPNLTAAWPNYKSGDINSYLLDENMRVLALTNVVELSKQEHAITSLLTNPEGTLYCPSVLEMQRKGSNQDLVAAPVQLKEGPYSTIRQDTSEVAVRRLQACCNHYMGGDGCEKFSGMTGLNNFYNFSACTQGISLHSKEVDVRRPPCNDCGTDGQSERPLLRLERFEGNTTECDEHERFSRKDLNPYFPGKCSCAVQSKCLAGSCVSKGETPFDACGKHSEGVDVKASMLGASLFDKGHINPEDKSITLGQFVSVKKHGPLKNHCHSAQWRDVPSKVIGNSNGAAIEKPARVSDGKGTVENHLADTAAKGFAGIRQEAESLKEQQMSNVCSGCSAPSVTEVSIEYNMESCTVDAANARFLHNYVIDEGSGIDRCYSSDDELDSGAWAETLNVTGKVDSILEGSSSTLPDQSCDLINERKLRNSFTLKSVRNQPYAGCNFEEKTHYTKKIEKELRERRKKRTTKWKKLDVSFPVSGLSSMHYNSPNCTGHSELQFHSSKEMEMPHERNGIQKVCFTHSTGPSSLKRKRSALSSAKALSQKKNLHALEDHHREWEHDRQTQLNADVNSFRIPKISASKKVRNDRTTDVKKQSSKPEVNHVGVGKAPKCISVSSVENISCHGVEIHEKKMRPVVSGNFGIISNGKLAGGRPKPPKIISLSSILKIARRCTVTENEVEPNLTSMLETKQSCVSRNGGCYDELFILKKEGDTECKNKIIRNEDDHISSSMLERKECFNRSKGCADELVMLKKGRNNGDYKTKKLSIPHGCPSAQLKPRFKETRKRSLYELTGKGKHHWGNVHSKISSQSGLAVAIGGKHPSSRKSCRKKILKSTLKTTFRSDRRTPVKNADFAQGHAGDLHHVNAKKSAIKERNGQPFLLDSDAFCCVCGSSNKDEVNRLLECSRCLIRVHQACYGVSKVPKVCWCCRPCRTSSKNIVCVLCGYEGGAMTRALRSRNIVKSLLKAWNVQTEFKSMNSIPSSDTVNNELSVLYDPTSRADFELKGPDSVPVTRPVNVEPFSQDMLNMDFQNEASNSNNLPSNSQVHNTVTAGVLDPTVIQWVHMVCGLWMPGTRCPNVDTMGAFDVSGVLQAKKDIVCSMCNRPGGSCIRCRILNCSVYFHPWCAHQKGLLQSEIEGIDNEKVGFYGRCILHATHHGYHADNHSVEPKIESPRKKEFTCARTEGYKGRKREEGFQHILHGQSNDNAGCLVPQEQINAWLHINGQKSCARGLVKLLASDIEYDCRKEYTRYKQAKGWKHLVVYKSGIHALGLYTSQFISRGAMVVEYVGEIVGLRVADKREIEYQSGRKLQYKSACYFFRIDKDHIIDATCKGGIARFVNHSCLPNCVAKVISVRNEKKVVFFAERDINPGEEITYDYHFNHEDEGKKIPCFCNSKNCRRYLN